MATFTIDEFHGVKPWNRLSQLARDIRQVLYYDAPYNPWEVLWAHQVDKKSVDWLLNRTSQ